MQKHTYTVTHTNDKISFSYKSNSKTAWKVTVDGNSDSVSDTQKDGLAISTYSDAPEDKSATLSIDRFMSYYNVDSTLLWPGIIYYTNNTYLNNTPPLKSEIIFSISGVSDNNKKLQINFSPGLYNDEMCHIKVFEIEAGGADKADSVLNACGTTQDGCYQLCQDGVISLTKEHGIVGVIVKRRFHSKGFKQYFKSNLKFHFYHSSFYRR